MMVIDSGDDGEDSVRVWSILNEDEKDEEKEIEERKGGEREDEERREEEEEKELGECGIERKDREEERWRVLYSKRSSQLHSVMGCCTPKFSHARLQWMGATFTSLHRTRQDKARTGQDNNHRRSERF
ncbi:hypothetical protein TWF481_011184 [Arthrobotrys musiformis]|uniref:Uncharacterized protein n=1 Tax=Arthrobotrys musiformis TaxID=47236 RepID=A0AAV9VZ18_9PEZI